MKILVALFIVLTSSLVTLAAMKQATISLTPPTSRVDGSALAPGDIKHYLIKAVRPDGVVIDIIMTGTSKMWTPPVVGEYTLTAYTVDSKDLRSKPSLPVKYTAELLPSEPNPPTILITIPIEGVNAHDEIDGKIIVPAISYLNLTPGPTGLNWTPFTADNVNGMRAPELGKVSTVQDNSRIDYLISATGGEYSLSIMGYAMDGLTDSLWLGLNGKYTEGAPNNYTIFAPNTERNKWLYTNPVSMSLPEGQSVISLFMRDKSYGVAEIFLSKAI